MRLFMALVNTNVWLLQFGDGYTFQSGAKPEPVLQATLVTVSTTQRPGQGATAHMSWTTEPGLHVGSSGCALFALDGHFVGLHYAGDVSGRTGSHFSHPYLKQLLQHAKDMMYCIENFKRQLDSLQCVMSSQKNQDQVPCRQKAVEVSEKELEEHSHGWTIYSTELTNLYSLRHSLM